MKYNMIWKNDLKQNETDKLSRSLESIKFAFKRLIIFFSTSLLILTTNHGK